MPDPKYYVSDRGLSREGVAHLYSYAKGVVAITAEVGQPFLHREPNDMASMTASRAKFHLISPVANEFSNQDRGLGGYVRKMKTADWVRDHADIAVSYLSPLDWVASLGIEDDSAHLSRFHHMRCNGGGLSALGGLGLEIGYAQR